MGIKILIASACTIAGEEVATHADVGEKVEVSKDDAAQLTRAGRAFYLDKSDDPTRGTLTATDADLARIKREAKHIADDADARATEALARNPAALLARIAALEAAAAAGAKAPA